MNGAGEAAASPTTSYFGIGATNNITTGGHIGHISEMILFNKVLTTAQITTIENNQMQFWGVF